jgi:hypothetical protein
VLQGFLKPILTMLVKLEKLLIDSYISSKNYKEALLLLEKNKSPENKLAYQKLLIEV